MESLPRALPRGESSLAPEASDHTRTLDQGSMSVNVSWCVHPLQGCRLYYSEDLSGASSC